MAENKLLLDVLKPYIDQEANRDKLIAESVLAPKSAGYFNLQTGVKGPTTINLLTADVVFGDGSECGLGEASEAKISQRQIVPAIMKVNLPICEKTLLNTYAQYQVKLKAGLETLPFEEYLTKIVADKTNAKIEKFIWQGDKEEDEVQFDGLMKILGAEGSGAVKVEAKSTEMATVLAVYNALPNEAHQDDLVVFAAPSKFRAWIQELVAANMYFWNANDKNGEYTIPGTDVKVVALPGLEGTDSYVAGRKSNFFYGVDIEDAADTVKVIYDEVEEMFYIKMLFNAGVQVAWPNEVVYVGE